VLSDDNFNPLQVTKALVFEVLPTDMAAGG
jgi:hypothetical protein